MDDREDEIYDFLGLRDFAAASLIMYQLEADHRNFAKNLLMKLPTRFQEFYKNYKETHSIEDDYYEAIYDLQKASR